MYLKDYDEVNGRFRTTVFYFLFRREGEQLSFAFSEEGYPAEPEWLDVRYVAPQATYVRSQEGRRRGGPCWIPPALRSTLAAP
jgi:hypothetical protein